MATWADKMTEIKERRRAEAIANDRRNALNQIFQESFEPGQTIETPMYGPTQTGEALPPAVVQSPGRMNEQNALNLMYQRGFFPEATQFEESLKNRALVNSRLQGDRFQNPVWMKDDKGRLYRGGYDNSGRLTVTDSSGNIVPDTSGLRFDPGSLVVNTVDQSGNPVLVKEPRYGGNDGGSYLSPQIAKQIEGIDDTYRTKGFAELDEITSNLGGYLKKYKADLPGVGHLKNIQLAKWLDADDAGRIRNDLDALRGVIINRKAGMAQTLPEIQNVLNMMALSEKHSAEQFVYAYNRFLKAYGRERRSLFGASPMAAKIYQKNTGIDVTKMPWENIREQGNASNPDVEKPKKAIKAGDIINTRRGRVLVEKINPDGSYEGKPVK